MILPDIAAIEALDPQAAFALAIEYWGSQLPPLADPSGKLETEDARVRNFVGELAGNDRLLRDMCSLAKAMLINERQRIDAGSAS